jgi:hypothetical protein
MIVFRDIEDHEPSLRVSPLVRATERTFFYIAEHGGIELTPSLAFKRNFVHWAAASFDWPGYTSDELFRVSKVLNEIDFAPLMYLHEMLVALRIGRHFKGAFTLTPAGKSLIGHPGMIFEILAPFFLFRVNHEFLSRKPMQLAGNWDVFLNVLNVEADPGISGRAFREILYGPHDPAQGYDEMMGGLYIQVLRPLCWAGLLAEHRPKGTYAFGQHNFVKTPLWRAALQLDTYTMVQPATRH